MNRQDLLDRIEQVLRSRDAAATKKLVQSVSMADLGEALSEQTNERAMQFWGQVPTAWQGDLFSHFDKAAQDRMLRILSRPDLIGLFEHLAADTRADIYKRMGVDAREKLLPALAQAEREDILRLSAYEENTVGAITTSDYVTIRFDMTVAQALREIRLVAPDKDTIYVLYVLNEQRKLVGTVSLSELVLATDDDRIEDLMHSEPVFAIAESPREEAARIIARHDLLAVPVVDADMRMIGIVTVDDAIDVAEEESTEDFHKVGGMMVLPDMSVRHATMFQLYRKRVYWLVILVFGNLLSGLAIAHFEETIAAYLALIFFLPLLIGSGGNAGSQAATLMVRALATGDVVMKDWLRMLSREFGTAALLGATMALAVSGIGLFRGGPEIALVVALSMILIVIIGSLIGMSLPFVLARLSLDPATASAPLVTSIADAAGVTLYLSLALLILGTPGAP